MSWSKPVDQSLAFSKIKGYLRPIVGISLGPGRSVLLLGPPSFLGFSTLTFASDSFLGSPAFPEAPGNPSTAGPALAAAGSAAGAAFAFSAAPAGAASAFAAGSPLSYIVEAVASSAAIIINFIYNL